MGYALPDLPLHDHLAVAHAYLPRIWSCSDCHTVGQLTFRADGWVITCPCPNCPAPETPASEYNPTPLAAVRHWNWKQGGPK